MKPHVLLITVDQWAADMLRCAGHPTVETPTIDALGRSGTRYVNAYSESPVCIPARRTLMTGTEARAHGDRTFQPGLEMPSELPTLAQTFRAAGYHTASVGKLHVYPKRDRIGFNEVELAEEGRAHIGGDDDYEIYLTDQGHAGQQFLHGMSNNEYGWRSWHLPEQHHVTNWITRSAARSIKRRDPKRPNFWHVGFTHPHPPLVPIDSYLERYRDAAVPAPLCADWIAKAEGASAFAQRRERWQHMSENDAIAARRAVFALCTHIDHQIRTIIGTLREEGILENTIIMFCADHGDMLGDFGIYGKRFFYEPSAKVPLIVSVPTSHPCARPGTTDDRLVGIQDVMPTLLNLCDIDVPDTCTGIPINGQVKREFLYGEFGEGTAASRMIRAEKYKLIWYPSGNIVQLFDLDQDPQERTDIADDVRYDDDRRRLEAKLIEQLYGNDINLVTGNTLVGEPKCEKVQPASRDLGGQRGLHYPAIPPSDPNVAVGAG